MSDATSITTQNRKANNKDEVAHHLEAALYSVARDYNIDAILDSLASATFLLRDDAGEFEGPADGTPFGG